MRFANVERRFYDELQPASAVLRQCCPFRKGDRFSAVVHEAEVLQVPLKRSAVRHLLATLYPRRVYPRKHESYG